MTFFPRAFALSILLLLGVASAEAQSFSGTVRNEQNQALGDMTVRAYNASGILTSTATTDSQGRYIMPVPAGTYRVLAFDRSGTYAVSFYRGASSFETSGAINLTAFQSLAVDFTLPRGLELIGSVREASTLRPLGGAIVAAYNLDGSRRSFTNASPDGTYTLIVPAGAYKLVAFHETQPFVPEFFVEQPLFESARTVNAPGFGINFTLEPGAPVRGTVVEKGTGVPLANVRVVAYDPQGVVRFRTETNASGAFTFVVPPGPYKFAAEDPSNIYEATFFGDVTQFAAAPTVAVDGNGVPQLRINPARVQIGTRKNTVWIAAAGSGPGANDTTFKTDLWIQNPTAEPITVTVTFLPSGRDNSAVTGLPVLIGARAQRSFLDVVVSLFGTLNLFGGLRLDSASDFSATSRTYNQPRNALLGTYGLSLPGQSIGDSRGRATLGGLAGNQLSRTNIGLLNPQPVAVTVTIALFAADGTALLPPEPPVTLQPLEWRQIRVLILNNVDNAYAVVTSSDGSFFSYAAVVDQRSGDGTIILPGAQ